MSNIVSRVNGFSFTAYGVGYSVNNGTWFQCDLGDSQYAEVLAGCTDDLGPNGLSQLANYGSETPPGSFLPEDSSAIKAKLPDVG